MRHAPRRPNPSARADHSGAVWRPLPPDPVGAIGPLRCGRAAVRIGSRWGFLDALGQLVIEARFHEALDFSHERAAVRLGRRWGYVDPSGELVIEARFRHAHSFDSDLAHVTLEDGRAALIDERGRLAWSEPAEAKKDPPGL